MTVTATTTGATSEPHPVPRDVLHVRCRQCRRGYVPSPAPSRTVLRVRSSAGACWSAGT
jgi:hypothetical protein